MLDCWNESIFQDIEKRLQDSAMKLIYDERNGGSFDSQLVIGVRESYSRFLHFIIYFKIELNIVYCYFIFALVNLCSNHEDRLQIYREYFEQAYINTTKLFYITRAPEYLEVHGIHDYMKYADIKIQEEKVRAQKYLDTNSCSVQKVYNKLI